MQDEGTEMERSEYGGKGHHVDGLRDDYATFGRNGMGCEMKGIEVKGE